jgi:hypothetical protein
MEIVQDHDDSIVEFPRSFECVPGQTHRVRVPSLLPDGRSPVTQLAVILGGNMDSPDLAEFNRQQATEFVIRSTSVGTARVLVTQTGGDRAVVSAVMTIHICPALCIPPLGSFGLGRFRNIKVSQKPR